MKKVVIHSDGGCHGNPGPGGWAAVLGYGKHIREIKGGVPATTNNRMELQAAIEALRRLKEPCHIDFHTDSQYVRQGISQWIAGWKRNGWRTRERTLRRTGQRSHRRRQSQPHPAAIEGAVGSVQSRT